MPRHVRRQAASRLGGRGFRRERDRFAYQHHFQVNPFRGTIIDALRQTSTELAQDETESRRTELPGAWILPEAKLQNEHSSSDWV